MTFDAGRFKDLPGIAVEIVGDSHTYSGLFEKALEHLVAGARMVCILDPKPRSVVIVTPPNHVRVLSEEDILDGADVLPGFRCKVAEMFA